MKFYHRRLRARVSYKCFLQLRHSGDFREGLENLKRKYGFKEPDRGDLEDQSIMWRSGKPDYSKANFEYLSGKTQNHAAGSLEEVVENLVKSWESEASHKVDMSQWNTIDHEVYKVQTNGGKVVDGEDGMKMGNYNALMIDCPTYKSYGNHSFEESHELFRDTFTSGFPWEVLKVLSGPPHVVFTWRHWGKFDGNFRGNKGNGEIVEMFGLCRVTVSKELKIQMIEAFFDPETFLQALEGEAGKLEMCRDGKALLGEHSGCPAVNWMKK